MHHKSKQFTIIIPGLRKSGGNDFVFKMQHDLNANVVSFFALENDYPAEEVSVIMNKKFTKVNYILYSPIILLFLLTRVKTEKIILTHILTWPLCFFKDVRKTFYFIQGQEWLFFGLISQLIFKSVKRRIKNSHVITTNKLLGKALENQGIEKYSIFLPITILKQHSVEKVFDYVIVRRSGAVKNALLVDGLIEKMPAHLKGIIINLGSENLSINHNQCIINGPVPHKNMIEYISQSKVIFLLSKSEGLSLPVIEAIQNFTVPIVLKNGISEELTDQTILPALDPDTPLSKIIERAIVVLSDQNLRQQVVKKNLIMNNRFLDEHRVLTQQFLTNFS